MQGANALVNQWKIYISRTGSAEDTRYALIITPIKGVRTPPHLQFSSGWKAEKKCVSGAKSVPASPNRKFTQSTSAKNYSNFIGRKNERRDNLSYIGGFSGLPVRLLVYSGSPRALCPRDANMVGNKNVQMLNPMLLFTFQFTLNSSLLHYSLTMDSLLQKGLPMTRVVFLPRNQSRNGVSYCH